ncbi:MAG: M56 family metallopeptidase [Vicinamibacterales bacterium]
MTFEARFVTIVLVAFAWASLVGSLAAPLVFARLRVSAPVDRARALLRLRLLPLAAGLLAASLAALSFALFEPRALDETYGYVLRGLAIVPLVLLAASLLRTAVAVWRTRRVLQGWLDGARPVTLDGLTIPALATDSAFPVVAVLGIVRPRLLIARSVLDTCSPDELQAILAHEQAHVDRHDNLFRLLLNATPDLLSWLPAAGRLHGAWQEATEFAADDAAGRHGDLGRVTLAQALVRVARLAPAGPQLVPTSALYRGERLEQRVARLLVPTETSRRHPSRARQALVALALVASLATLEMLHEAFEIAAAVLP